MSRVMHHLLVALHEINLARGDGWPPVSIGAMVDIREEEGGHRKELPKPSKAGGPRSGYLSNPRMAPPHAVQSLFA